MITELFDDELIAAASEMPEEWQSAETRLPHVPDIGFISLRLRSFYAKMEYIGMAYQAREAMGFYARDWLADSYPDSRELRLLVGGAADAELRHDIISAVEEVRDRFGYWMPASFYGVLLAPALRPDVREARMLRYSELDASSARGWDASLHAMLKAADIGLFVQAAFSRRGCLISHGCDCNHKTTEIVRTGTSAFSYDFTGDDQLWRQVMAYWWHAWWEYAVFSLQPNTLVGSAYSPHHSRA